MYFHGSRIIDMRPILSIVFSFLFLVAVNAQFQQIGLAIVGESVGDMSGNSVSLSADGSCMAIGAFDNDGGSSGAGHVRVYDWSSATWLQVGVDIDGESTDDASGISVSLSANGDRVAIGAGGNDGNGSLSGHVRVYDRNGSAWVQVGADIDGENAGDGSGFSVSLSANGDRLAIGATGNNDNGAGAGQVRVYEWSGTVWAQLGVDIDGENAGDRCGWSASFSADGNRLAISSPLNDANGSAAGHVRVFDWDGTAWVQLGAAVEGEAAGDQSGFSISLSADGTTLAVGATLNDDNGSQAGHVRVYGWNGTAWSQLGADIDSENADDRFGFSVSLSVDGSRVAVGASGNDDNGTASGHVRVYNWNGTAWLQFGLDIDGAAADDRSGVSVSLSTDGSSVAIGAPGNDGNGSESGHVRVYSLLCSTIVTIDTSICFRSSIAGYTASGNYIDTFNVAGCDSIRTLNLTVLAEQSSSINNTICFGESFLGYSSSGIYSDTFDVNGCDSIRTLDLTVLPAKTIIFDTTICFGGNYLSYSTSGIYSDTFDVSGCDSIWTLNLTILPDNSPVLTQTDDTLFITDTYVSYTWLQDGSPIIGAISSELIITSNGSYQIIVQDVDGCTFSSDTLKVALTSTAFNSANTKYVEVYPNPAAKWLQVRNINPSSLATTFTLYTLAGKQVLSENFTQQSATLILDVPAGTYLYIITEGNRQVTIDKLVIVE